MARKQGFEALDFGRIDKKKFPEYVLAVQNCAAGDYTKMIKLIKSIFPA